MKNDLEDLQLFPRPAVEHVHEEGDGVSEGRGRAVLAEVDVSPAVRGG